MAYRQEHQPNRLRRVTDPASPDTEYRLLHFYMAGFPALVEQWSEQAYEIVVLPFLRRHRMHVREGLLCWGRLSQLCEELGLDFAQEEERWQALAALNCCACTWRQVEVQRAGQRTRPAPGAALLRVWWPLAGDEPDPRLWLWFDPWIAAQVLAVEDLLRAGAEQESASVGVLWERLGLCPTM